MKRILHVISGLDRGGAETTLRNLLSRFDRQRFSSEVVSLTPIGAVGLSIAEDGHTVRSLEQRRGVPNPAVFLRLLRVIRKSAPDLVQTWLYHADLVGGISARLLGIPVVWNLRSGPIDRNVMKWTTILTMQACARLSRHVPARIVACSEVSRRVHAELGYDDSKVRMIHNGFDVDVFRPDRTARAEIRAELGIADDAPVIGMIARYDPLKNHPMFIRAAASILRAVPQAEFVLCGSGITADNAAIVDPIRELGLSDRMHLLGERRDVNRVNAALDVACSTSYSEGFPNIVGEAMASQVPCVVTEAGDSAFIVGDTGRVVKTGDGDAFAAACVDLLSLSAAERAELGRRCRARIAEQFSLHETVRRYEDLYTEITA